MFQDWDPKRIWRAAGYALSGLQAAWRGERAFRQEVILLVPGLVAAFWLGQSGAERALLSGSLLLVLMAELVNTAIEAVVNRISSDRHELSGLAKDVASAVVLLALVNVVLIWGLVLFT